MKKSLLSLLLAVGLLISMLPSSVFAAEGGAKSGTIFIDTVEVTFTAPKVGAKPVYSASVNSGANYIVHPEFGAMWYNDLHDYLPENAVFESGKGYIFEAVLIPKDGYSLGVYTDCYLNGHSVGKEYFENEDGAFLIVEAYFKLDDIDTVSITITEPKAGARPDYNPVLPDENDILYHPYDQHTSAIENGIRWDETESWETLMVLSDKFEYLHAYSVTCYIEANFGQSFSPSATVYVNGKKATISYINSAHTIISIRYDFPALIPSGWVKIDGKWYYYANDIAVTGWKKISGKWYYLNSSGSMVTGWKKISNKWYYFESSGAMVADSSKTINGKTYYFNSSGFCMNP